jgi:hypothetical protein
MKPKVRWMAVNLKERQIGAPYYTFTPYVHVLSKLLYTDQKVQLGLTELFKGTFNL